MNESQMKIIISAKEQVLQAFNRVNKQFQTFQSSIERMEPAFRNMRNYGAVAFTSLSYGIKKVVDVSNDMESAMIGLDSIAKAFGQNSEDAKEESV